MIADDPRVRAMHLMTELVKSGRYVNPDTKIDLAISDFIALRDGIIKLDETQPSR